MSIFILLIQDQLLADPDPLFPHPPSHSDLSRIVAGELKKLACRDKQSMLNRVWFFAGLMIQLLLQ
jgi:hypothetical protein